MLARLFRAFRNDATLYREIKEYPDLALESTILVFGTAGVNFILSILLGMFYLEYTLLQAVVNAVVSAIGFLVGYLLLTAIAWLLGTKMGGGTASFDQIRTALGYVYPIPNLLALLLTGVAMVFPLAGCLTVFIGLWFLVIASSAIRETLGINKGLTFAIVLAAIVTISIVNGIAGGITAFFTAFG